VILTPEGRHADIMKRFPVGITPAQFRMLTLESADQDGKIDPPSVADWFAAQSILIAMWMDGLIERRGGRNDSGPWFITAKGIAATQKEEGES
jgi:hypothetical protein